MVQGSVVSEEWPSGRADLFPGSGGSGLGNYPPETRCLFATSLFSWELAQLFLPLGSGDPFQILQCWDKGLNSGSFSISFHRETAKSWGFWQVMCSQCPERGNRLYNVGVWAIADTEIISNCFWWEKVLLWSLSKLSSGWTGYLKLYFCGFSLHVLPTHTWTSPLNVPCQIFAQK